MSQRYNDNRARAKRKSARDLKNLVILQENSAEGLRPRREHCWDYVSIYENTPEKLPHLSPKRCCNFTLKAAATLLIGLKKCAVKA